MRSLSTSARLRRLGWALRWAAAGLIGITALSPAGAPARGAAPVSIAPAVQEHVLENGMKILLVPRRISPTVAAGWVAKVGSANERPGITGISHLFEHMMFKGTRTIGTRDADADQRFLDEQTKVQEEMRGELALLREAQRRGEIEDMTQPEAKTPRYRALEARFDSLVAAQRAIMVKNEFDNILQRNGGSRINAFTNEDMTFYFESVPSNKLELWFWLESDRIMNPVLREFYSERDVVREERRLRIESTPTGKFEESFDAMFWDASPYAWPVIGWPSDVESLTREQAEEYYALYYAPQNLCAVLVGDFDPAQALALARRYLGRIPRGPRPAPEVVTMEPNKLAERRFYAEAETNPALTVRWHAVAHAHRDQPALEVLAGALNGPTGRLRRKLILEQGLATNAYARVDARKYEGMFEIHAEAKDGHTPEEVERALYAEIDRLQKEPITASELQGVKNRFLTSTYRQLDGNFFQMIRYGINEARGSWRDARRLEDAIQKVGTEDLQRVARTYFSKENRTVAVWTRKGGAEEDPALDALPPEAKAMVRNSLSRLRGMDDPAQIQQMLDRFEQMAGQAPPQMKGAIDYVRAAAQARLAELSAGQK